MAFISVIFEFNRFNAKIDASINHGVTYVTIAFSNAIDLNYSLTRVHIH